MARTSSEMKVDFGGLGAVTDGANEACSFVEVMNVETGKFVTIDERSLAEFSDANYASFLALIAAHLGEE
jgi:hypothetical protein